MIKTIETTVRVGTRNSVIFSRGLSDQESTFSYYIGGSKGKIPNRACHFYPSFFAVDDAQDEWKFTTI